jgi:hypothetical protein
LGQVVCAIRAVFVQLAIFATGFTVTNIVSSERASQTKPSLWAGGKAGFLPVRNAVQTITLNIENRPFGELVLVALLIQVPAYSIAREVEYGSNLVV